jgi:hypothetical protein
VARALAGSGPIKAVALRASLAAQPSNQSRYKAISYNFSRLLQKIWALAPAVSLLLFAPAASLPSVFAVLAKIAFFIVLTIAKPRYP